MQRGVKQGWGGREGFVKETVNRGPDCQLECRKGHSEVPTALHQTSHASSPQHLTTKAGPLHLMSQPQEFSANEA